MGSQEKKEMDLPHEMSVVQEGQLKFYSYQPEDFSDGGKMLNKSMPVFYNPIQELNRSMTLIAYKAYQQRFKADYEAPIKILDAMAASGIRSLRLAQFLDPPFALIANDLNPHAVDLIRKNIQLNNLEPDIEISTGDCNKIMTEASSSHALYDIIDIDPFGTPNFFIPSAVTAINPGGILAVTATDTPVLFGVRPSACARKYNVTALRSTFSKEIGLRILIHYIAKLAHPLMKTVKPLLSLSFDHYIRVFLQIERGKDKINKNLSDFGYSLWCPHCDWRRSFGLDILAVPKNCPQCNSKLKFGGPLWTGKLHDDNFVQDCFTIANSVDAAVIPSKRRIIKTLNMVAKENEFPLGYYNLHKLCDQLQISVPSMKNIKQSLQERGYRMARTHIDDHSIKSDIDIGELTSILFDFHKKRN